MKLGAVSTADSSRGIQSALTFLNWRTLAGLTSFGIAGLLYAVLLRSWPLSLAQSLMAAQFVLVILVSWVVLREPIHPAQWLGITLIAAGIAVVGLAQR
jgi:drug/metabolite transporter (DMT)-like permease